MSNKVLGHKLFTRYPLLQYQQIFSRRVFSMGAESMPGPNLRTKS